MSYVRLWPGGSDDWSFTWHPVSVGVCVCKYIHAHTHTPLREQFNQPQVYSVCCTYWQQTCPQPDVWRRHLFPINTRPSIISTPVHDPWQVFCEAGRCGTHSVQRKCPFQLKVSSFVFVKIEPSKLFMHPCERLLVLVPSAQHMGLTEKNSSFIAITN